MTKPATSIYLGSYQLLERVGEGGTSHVHRARDGEGNLVAIKLLAPGAELDEPSVRARFQREVDALAALDHPGVLPLLDSGVDDELGPYLVTPLVTGKSLRELLSGVGLPPEGMLLLLRALAGAAAALHQAGLVHRDLKPENTMAHPDGHLVLFDLGLAYRAGQTRYTDEGEVVGSVPYMAPEQLEGRAVSGATDVWAIGIIAYESMMAARPFARDRTAEEAAAILVGRYPAASAADRRVGKDVDELIAACLAAEPEARPDAAGLAARASALIDWTDDPDAELAALVANPAGFQDRVKRFRVGRLTATAREQLAQGSAFAALRTIDRALAYDPDDAELAALAESAHAVAPASNDGAVSPPAPSSAPPPPVNRWLLPVGGLLVLAIIAGAVVLGVSGDDDDGAGVASSGSMSVEAASTPATPVGADHEPLALVGDFIDLFKKGIEASETADRRKALAAANPAPTPAKTDALAGVEAIAVGELRNDDRAVAVDLAAAPGEPLVPLSILGAADPAATMADFDARARSRPGDADTAVARALVYLAAGRTEAGLTQLEALVSSHAGSAAVWAAHGFVQLRQGNWKEAEVALGRAVELDPKDAQSLRNRGILRSRLGRSRDAYLDLVRALRLEAGDADALRELATIYRRAGRPDDAAVLARRAAGR